MLVLFFTQEYAVDLHSVGILVVSLNTRDGWRRKHRFSHNTRLYHRSPFFPLGAICCVLSSKQA